MVAYKSSKESTIYMLQVIITSGDETEIDVDNQSDNSFSIVSLIL